MFHGPAWEPALNLAAPNASGARGEFMDRKGTKIKKKDISGCGRCMRALATGLKVKVQGF